MSRYLPPYVALAVMLLIGLSCGDDESVGPNTTTPTVASSTPANGETDVGLLPMLEIGFSEAMDASTINDTTITLTAMVPGLLQPVVPPLVVTYDDGGQRALCYPDSTLAAGITYSLNCSDAVTDVEGNAAAAPWSISFSTGPADCAHLTDRFEENDTIAVAIPIDRDTWYRTLTDCDADGDFYRFTVDDTAKVRFDFTIRHAPDGTWYTEFFRADGASYSWSSSSVFTGDTAVRTYTFLPGTYYIKMLAIAPSHFLYDFTWSMQEPCEDDAYEDNDFPDEAAPIAPGTLTDLRGCFVDRDYYAVEVAAGQTLTVTASSGYAGNRRMRILNPQGSQVAYYNGTDEPSMVQATITTTGTCRFMLRVWSNDVVYDLSVELTD